VFKEDGPRAHRAKYITSNAGITDIRLSIPNLSEMPAEFFTNRILLLAAFLEEEGIPPSGEIRARLGGALLDGLFEAIGQYRQTRHVYDRHRCLFRRKANAELMIDFLSRRTREMQVIPRRLEREGEFYALEFDKVYPGMTGLISHLLGGGLLFD
jgi:putative ATP-dependent DNA ligase